MIEIDQLQKSYGTVKAINGVTLKIPKGQVLGLLGPNGAGKSSTLRILTGFLRPSSGRVTVAGVDVVEDPLKVKKMIGYLPESAPTYTNMLVYDYLIFIARSRGIPQRLQRQKVTDAATHCALLDYMSRPISQLSKGYRQRVGLAMAMINDPEVLVLDEPTSGLDPNQIVEIRNLIRQLGQEKTVIFSTHILSEAESTCDRIVIIDKGKIIADDRAKDLSQSVFKSTEIQLLLAEASADQVEAEIRKLAGVESLTCTKVDDHLQVKVTCSTDLRLELAKCLWRNSWMPLELHQVKKSLETVFHQLTESTSTTT